MQCKRCGKQGILKRYKNKIPGSNPPQYPWYWWCSCGNIQEGGVEQGVIVSEIYQESWKSEDKL